MNSTRSSKDKKGFTLLEVLIAVFILSIVISTVYASYRGSFTLIQGIGKDNETYGMARNAMQRLIDDFSSLAPSGGKFKFVSAPAKTAGIVLLDLTFMANAHLDFGEKEGPSGIAEVTYYLEEGEAEEGYRLMRQDVLATEASQQDSERKGYVLCERLQSVTYRFYDNKGQEYDSWDSSSDTAIQKNKAPQRIFIELQFINENDKDDPLKFMTQVLLPLSALAGP